MKHRIVATELDMATCSCGARDRGCIVEAHVENLRTAARARREMARETRQKKESAA